MPPIIICKKRKNIMKRKPIILRNQIQEVGVCLFFCMDRKFKVHTCQFEEAEDSGLFLNYPHSHLKIWDKEYASKHPGIDFDYYPRGRVIYRKEDDTYFIYYDKCIGEGVEAIASLYKGKNVVLSLDEHYKCANCNTEYYL